MRFTTLFYLLTTAMDGKRVLADNAVDRYRAKTIGVRHGWVHKTLKGPEDNTDNVKLEYWCSGATDNKVTVYFMGANKATIENNNMLCPRKDTTADSITSKFDDTIECNDTIMAELGVKRGKLTCAPGDKIFV